MAAGLIALIVLALFVFFVAAAGVRIVPQARTLGARGLSYYGMDSTYASTLAILRRVLKLEGVLGAEGA